MPYPVRRLGASRDPVSKKLNIDQMRSRIKDLEFRQSASYNADRQRSLEEAIAELEAIEPKVLVATNVGMKLSPSYISPAKRNAVEYAAFLGVQHK